MARLTEEMVIARSKQSDLTAIKKLNCWGAELGDVSLLRRMPNVEVLALSINKIRTLVDFAGCRRLRELYVRKNEIGDLSEIRHLRALPNLTSLWLDENPCTLHPQYRMTVLRNLPNLEKLDNVPVQPDEVQEAMRLGVHIPDSDDEGYPQQDSYSTYRGERSCDSSPERCHSEQYYVRHQQHQQHQQHPPHEQPPSDSSESVEAAQDTTRHEHTQCRTSPVGRGVVVSPECEERYEHVSMSRSQYEAPRPRSPDVPPSLRHSHSAHNVKEYTYSSNGDCRGGSGGRVASPPQYHDSYYERPDRSESYVRSVPDTWEGERAGSGSGVGAGSTTTRGDRDYTSAVMAEHRGFTRRPVTRNSNLLSAVLCLVKELDYPSLEVAEMAVRCRMDELANGQ